MISSFAVQSSSSRWNLQRSREAFLSDPPPGSSTETQALPLGLLVEMISKLTQLGIISTHQSRSRLGVLKLWIETVVRSDHGASDIIDESLHSNYLMGHLMILSVWRNWWRSWRGEPWDRKKITNWRWVGWCSVIGLKIILRDTHTSLLCNSSYSSSKSSSFNNISFSSSAALFFLSPFSRPLLIFISTY